MGAIARQGPHHVAQKSTRTGLSDFKTSGSKFAPVTSTIPLPAIFFLLVVDVALSADAPSGGAAGPAICISASPEGCRTYYRNTAIGCRGVWESRKRTSIARALARSGSKHRSRQAGQPLVALRAGTFLRGKRRLARIAGDVRFMRCRKEKAPSTFQSRTLGRAALPQNCQTTRWILEAPSFYVNVTLVTLLAES